MARGNSRNIIIIRALLFVASIAAFYLVLPMSTTPVNPILEDTEKYFAALELQAKKMAFQQTLPGNEEVLDLYETPTYFQVKDTCNWAYAGTCVQAMTGPGPQYPKAAIHYEHLGAFPAYVRDGQVFPMAAKIKATDGSEWYKIAFDTTKMQFPGRLQTNWYVPADHFDLVDLTPIDPQSDDTKNIVIVLHEQKLYAYEGQNIFMTTNISSGQDRFSLGTGTGTFHIFKKIPMTPMEGPLPGMVSLITPQNLPDFEYTLFVPYAMAFSIDVIGTSFIHEAYWHNSFGSQRSHGCINVSYNDARILYNWVPNTSITKIPVVVVP